MPYSLTLYIGIALFVANGAAELPGGWAWQSGETNNATLDPSRNGILHPTAFYRSRDNAYYFAFGFLDGFGTGGTKQCFNVELFRLPNTNVAGQNFETIAVGGTPPQGRAWSTGVYDPITDAVYLYGGVTCANVSYPLSDPSCVIQDWENPTCLLFAGPSIDTYGGVFLNDTVVLDFAGPNGPVWRTLTPPPGSLAAAPPPLGAVRAVYDPDSTALVLWSFWADPSAFSATLPVWRLDLLSHEWTTVPVATDSLVLPTLGTDLTCFPAIEFDAGHNRLVAFFGQVQQLLLFDLATGRWSAPQNAINTMPSPRTFMSSCILSADTTNRWFVIHGGSVGNVVLSETFLLDMSTWIWHEPTVAQLSAPSLQRHVGIPVPGQSWILWWGGEGHGAVDTHAGRTFQLDFVPPLQPAVATAADILPLPALLCVVFGALLCAGLMADFFAHLCYSRLMPQELSLQDSSGLDPFFGLYLSAAHGVIGTASFFAFATVTVSCPFSTAQKEWELPTAAALFAWSGLVSCSSAALYVKRPFVKLLQTPRRMFCLVVACASSGALSYALQIDSCSASTTFVSSTENSDFSLRRLSVEASDYAEPAEEHERTRRRNALTGIALVDVPMLVFLVVLLCVESSTMSPPVVIVALICTTAGSLMALASAMYATTMLLGLSQFKLQASQLDLNLGYVIYGPNSLEAMSGLSTPRSRKDLADEAVIVPLDMQPISRVCAVPSLDTADSVQL